MVYDLGNLFTLAGSLGIFLYGMKVMSDALMNLAGDRLRAILAKATANRLGAVLSGFSLTALVQSSSATTLMVVSFANASLLTLTESIGVIMGANIGTTVTAWLISLLGFKISLSAIAFPLFATGFVLSNLKGKATKNTGLFLVGFSLLFIGLQLMKESMPPFDSSTNSLDFLAPYIDKGMLSILFFLALGTILTVVLQSSSATMAITILLCASGWIPFELGAAMVLGENIGTTVTANIAAYVNGYRAKRAARAHLIFNAFGIVWVLALFSYFIPFVDKVALAVSGQSPLVQIVAIPVGLALFHTLFNVLNTCLLIGFIPLISRIVCRMVPESSEEKPYVELARHLDKAALKYPQTATKAMFDEILRLYKHVVFEVITHGMNVHRSQLESDSDLKVVIKHAQNIEIDVDRIYYQRIKGIYGQLIEFSTNTHNKFDLDVKEITIIHDIIAAGRLMVESVKYVKPFHANLLRYSHSDNIHIRDEYNRLRRLILSTLRVTHHLRADENWQRNEQACHDLREHIDLHDVLLNGTIDRLVREQLISVTMATSLMNDSRIAINLAHGLLDTYKLLTSLRDRIIGTKIQIETEAVPDSGNL